VTPVAAEAMPSGPVLEDAYERMAGAICDAVAQGCDAAMLDLHGAMVAEHLADGEGELLRRLRAIAPGLPIAVTCDLHCNLTEAMIENSTALIGYKTYPHVDMHAVGRQVGEILLRSLKGEARPVMAWGNRPLLAQTLRMGHDDEPMKGLIAMARAEEDAGVLAATVFGGFPLADIKEAGLSAVVIADGDAAAAEAAAGRLLDRAWTLREDFVYPGRPIGEALDEAKGLADGPVILLDHADNCGSGGTQDEMTAIRAALDAGLEDVAVATVWEPAAVETMAAAGVGADVTLDLGGRTELPSIARGGEPLRVTGRVRTLSDGRWIVRGPMYTGVEVHMGPTGVLEVGGMLIVVTSNHHEPWDLGVFRSVGIEPTEKRFLLLKSRIHYRAGFAPIAQHTLTLDGDGVTTSDNSRLEFVRLRRPIFPLDRINEP
jgi:microcystin degradation protein MlrC